MVRGKVIIGAIIIGCVIASGAAVSPTPSQPAPAAPDAQQVEHNAKALKVTAGAAALRKLMRNPASFSLVNAILMKDGSVCYDYRGQNGFGGMTEEQATMTPKGTVTADPAVYAKFCTGKFGEDFVQGN